MVIEEHFIQTSGHQQIFTRICLPESRLAGILLVVHGLGEHCGRYATHFSKFYTGHDYGIVAFDLPGHGKSEGPRGHIDKPFALIEIIDHLLKKIIDRFPSLATYIYGHSFGGEITLWYTLVRKPAISGVILSAPLIGPKDPVPFPKLIVAKTMERVMPSFSMDNGLPINMLSRDPEIITQYQADPLVHSRLSARTGMIIINRGKWISDHIHENTENILLMVGGNEGIVNLKAVEQLAKNSSKIHLKIWPNLYHELHNEPEKIEVVTYTLNWMRKIQEIS